MKIEDQRDQGYRQQQARRDAPSQLEPDRIERNLLSQTLALDVASIKEVREYREHGTKEKLKHGCASPSSNRRDRRDVCHRPSEVAVPARLRELRRLLRPSTSRRQSSRPIRRCSAAAS